MRTNVDTLRGLIRNLQAQIAELAAQEYLVATNAGTFGGGEAARKVGTADPQFATREVYETVGGVKRTIGPDRFPGRLRAGMNRETLRTKRAELADLRRQLSGLHAAVNAR